VNTSETEVPAEVTGTKSTSVEDLAETDGTRGDFGDSNPKPSDSLESSEAAEDLAEREEAKGDPSDSDTESSASFESSDAAVKSVQEGPDSELSDTVADQSPSHSCHGETRQIAGASAPGRAETNPDTGKECLTCSPEI
jgi:hypothetical protein